MAARTYTTLASSQDLVMLMIRGQLSAETYTALLAEEAAGTKFDVLDVLAAAEKAHLEVADAMNFSFANSVLLGTDAETGYEAVATTTHVSYHRNDGGETQEIVRQRVVTERSTRTTRNLGRLNVLPEEFRTASLSHEVTLRNGQAGYISHHQQFGCDRNGTLRGIQATQGADGQTLEVLLADVPCGSLVAQHAEAQHAEAQHAVAQHAEGRNYGPPALPHARIRELEPTPYTWPSATDRASDSDAESDKSELRLSVPQTRRYRVDEPQTLCGPDVRALRVRPNYEQQGLFAADQYSADPRPEETHASGNLTICWPASGRTLRETGGGRQGVTPAWADM